MSPSRPYDWGAWTDLKSAGKGFGPGGGLYRVRDGVTLEVLYIGESSRLAGRMTDLRNCLRDEIPYADPHTAAPALWAYQRSTGHFLEVSLARFHRETPERRSWESVEIASHRASKGRSPLFSFGRMLDGWVKSSGNNTLLKESGRLMRGFQSPDARVSASLAPIADLKASPIAVDWCGLTWTDWTPELPEPQRTGIYRIRHVGAETLQYIGIGKIRSRLSSHVKKGTQPDHPQFEYFNTPLEFSWHTDSHSDSTQLAEIENDLIASHVLSTGSAPPAQFKG